MFAASKDSVWLGESIFSLPHFLGTLSFSSKPLLNRAFQKHLILYCLKNFSLKYFRTSQISPNLANSFLTAIRQLKRYDITTQNLRECLKESGSLKENDLLTIYERYEELKNKLDLIDEEDQYTIAIENLSQQNALKGISELILENFSEIPPQLDKVLKTVQQKSVEVAIHLLPDINLSQLKEISLFSLASPYQETNWFLKKIAEVSANIPLTNVGILTGGNPFYYEPLWQKLKNSGLTEGESPFLSLREQVLGRNVTNKALAAPLQEATLTNWLETLNINELAPYGFPEKILSLGLLGKWEWIAWLKDCLDAKTQTPINEALSGVQWCEVEAGDYPFLECLWAPGLIEGQFPVVTPSPFFQDSRDRGREEWKILKEAFPDPQTILSKKRKAFLFQLSRVKEAWLSFPRLDSLGNDLSPSSFTWDFELKEEIGSVAPPLLGTGTVDQEVLTQKLQIEEERLQDDLKTNAFHTNFTDESLGVALPPQRENFVFSPTQLEAYAACPFKYYAWKVLNIPRIKEYSPEVDPEDKGTLFHNCLEELLTKQGALFDQARSDSQKEEALYAELKQIVEKTFSEMQKELSYANPELYERLKQTTLAQAQEVLKNELEESRQLEAPLKPQYFEWTFGTSSENALSLEKKQNDPKILIGGRIDRIDIDAGKKRFLVLDYKTGNTEALKDKLLEGLTLQLPVYLLAVKRLLLKDYQAVGGLLISVRSARKKHGLVDSRFNETHFSLGKRSSALLASDDFDKTLSRSVEQIQEYVLKIREGFFSAQPKDCRHYCDYKEICRYANKPMD
ncbi:MAG: hypothetical protein A3F82_00530 [Deltaproteobacteria bacterium RIFCSPLOWO2_12_FULL_44_12]|nr:MAG: hypothetical protein A2712_04425 [Deltaproteobacteria bacterium RIFCSPHIGHO2_01_FULL_43_49]OGQ16429.1 MAG: hypothetical protein A3D22_02390 [Deltaproteobacteria bacterium RIFCSPHIGHO2_02_FULL_44_53]OGQ27743.1 MAG: hypothetical protein A3D98_08595 [Deltaproteobacteria bacterium RIFCSPHIGHO2_12_FULL_44_21]OGQ32947.1 MAG: hypothetical protein A2979_10320 [Deltaproteobacteria bacterium RIFCSPLOWO2_01_FULL_45_74]OGQ71481.1 MAG: hypothetical protein A3F82_00530 [Deltaproteobacteria bacterium 